MKKELREQLLAAQKAAAKALEDLKKFEDLQAKEAEEQFSAITQNIATYQEMWEVAEASNREDVRLSGTIEGIPGTVSIAIRYGEILNRKRNAKKKEGEQKAESENQATAECPI